MATAQFNTVRKSTDELRAIVNARSKVKHRALSKVFSELQPDTRPYKIVQGVFRNLESELDAAHEFIDELESDEIERIENIRLNATFVPQANVELKQASVKVQELKRALS